MREGGLTRGRSFARAQASFEQRALEHIYSVVVQIRTLLSREFADSYTSVDSPRVHQLVFDLWNNYQLLTPGEGDVALVEQMIDVWREKQSVGTVEPLRVAG